MNPPELFCDVGIRGGARISATAPILVGHFMKGRGETFVGDPAFTLVVPTLHHICGHRFYSFQGFDWDGSVSGAGSYVNIVTLSESIDQVLLDGYPIGLPGSPTCLNYERHDYSTPGPGTYSWAKCRLVDPVLAPVRQHTLKLPAATDVPFAAYAYGQGIGPTPADPLGKAEAYAYPTGMGFE